MNQVQQKLNRLEKEIHELKCGILQQVAPKVKVSLRGTLKGVVIGRKEIEEAKRSLFPAPRR